MDVGRSRIGIEEVLREALPRPLVFREPRFRADLVKKRFQRCEFLGLESTSTSWPGQGAPHLVAGASVSANLESARYEMPPVDVSYIESTVCRFNNQAPNTIIHEQMTTVENLGTSFHTIAEAAKTEGFVLMEHTLRLRLYLKGCGGGDPRGVVVRYAGNQPRPQLSQDGGF